MIRRSFVISLLLSGSIAIALGEDDLPQLQWKDLASRIAQETIGGYSLNQNITLSEFRKLIPETDWDYRQFSDRTYCDPQTGKCCVDGLMIGVQSETTKATYLFDGEEPTDRLIGVSLEVLEDEDEIRSIIAKLTQGLGKPTQKDFCTNLASSDPAISSIARLELIWIATDAETDYQYSLTWSFGLQGKDRIGHSLVTGASRRIPKANKAEHTER